MGLNQAFPKVDIAPDGSVYVVWMETVNQTFNRDVRLAKSVDAGSTFLPSVLVPRNGTSTSEDMGNLAIGTDGVIHVAWEDWRNDADGMFKGDGGIDGVNNSDIFYGRSLDGGLSFNQIKVNDDNTTLWQSFPIGRTLAVGDDGKAHIVWNDRRNSPPPLDAGAVYYSTSVDGVSFKANLEINDPSVKGPGNPTITVSGADKVFVAYDGYNVSTNTSAIYLTRSLDGGATFDGGKRVSLGAGASYPSLASEGNRVVVAWMTGAPSAMIYVRASTDNGTTFGPETPVETPASLTVYFSTSIDIDRLDRIAVSWFGGVSADWDVFYSSSTDLGATFSPIQRLNDDVSGRKQYSPSVALDGNGYVYLAWSDARIVAHNDIYFTRAPLELADLSLSSTDISLTPPGPVGTGTPVTIAATVLNNGDRNASQVKVAFHDGLPSTSNQIRAIQTILFIQYFGGTGIASVIWPAGPPGTHDICVVVDPENNITESNETNNQACNSIEVIIPPVPDLTVSPGELTLFPVPPYVEGSQIQINATVRNIGGNVSGATVARFHDGVPPSPNIGTDQPFPPIPIGGAENVSVLWIATPSGSHLICVVADPDDLVAEIDETNNMACAPVQVVSKPDLVPLTINVIPSPPVLVGTVVQVNVSLENRGDTSSGDFELLLFDDSNSNIVPDVGEDIDSNALSSLNGHAQTTTVFSWTATPLGLRSVCAYADPPPSAVDESNETNNVLCVGVLVQPGPVTRPDYMPFQPQPSQQVRTGLSLPVSLSVIVHNQGNATATVDATGAFCNQTSPSTPFATFTATPSPPGSNSSRFTATWTSPATPGIYYVTVDVDSDDDIPEWDETNNVYTWTIEVVIGPVTSLVIGNPNHTAATTFVKSSTPLDFFVIDQSMAGIRNTTYRIDGGGWVNYTLNGTFYLAGEGEHAVESYSVDYAGNTEESVSLPLTVDDTPPVTTASHPSGEFVTGTTFTLSAVDSGSGVQHTEYRIDGGNWTVYRTGFTVPEGNHIISYRSIDNLGNLENEGSISVTIVVPPPSKETNYKPLVAAVFSIILFVAGLWSSRRKPWRNVMGRKAVVKAFMFISLPFVLAEVATGVFSFLTGQLSIPPLLGVGTAVDLGILMAGVAVAGLQARRRPRSKENGR